MSKSFHYCAAMLLLAGSVQATEPTEHNAGSKCTIPELRCQADSAEAFTALPALLPDLLNPVAETRYAHAENANGWASFSAQNPETNSPWQFSINSKSHPDMPSITGNGNLPANGMNANFTHQITNTVASVLHERSTDPEQRAHITRAVSGFDALLQSLNDNADVARPIGALPGKTAATPDNLLNNLLRHAGDIRVSATMPIPSGTQLQGSEELLQKTINDDKVTQYLEQHTDIVIMLAKMLGWESTGLIPSAEDVQKMASSHLTAVANSIEGWALNNVEFTSDTIALANADHDEALMQWQWEINSGLHNSNNANTSAYTGSTLSTNLRALFGMSDY